MARRILICSTPKTGNTWLRNLLAHIYQLPQHIPWHIDRLESPTFEGWIGHVHWAPTPSIVSFLRDHEVTLLTTIRHPADVLISLYHHVNRFRAATEDMAVLRRMLREDFRRAGGIYSQEPKAPFSYDLNTSLAWIRTGATTPVRYEDLWRNPAAVLTGLTNSIEPVDQDRIDMAIALCDINLMRLLAGPNGGFFREGQVGRWVDILAPCVIDEFRREPYVSQLRELGYTLTRGDLEASAVRSIRPHHNPFLTVTHFDNGVRVSPILVKCFLSSEPSLRRKWFPVKRIDAESFAVWLTQPSLIGGCRLYMNLPISNLALFIYRDRPDVQCAFPDLTSGDRVRYLEWYLTYARSEYQLDEAFIAPVRRALAEWGQVRERKNPKVDAVGTISRYARHLWRSRPDLQAAFPDIDNADCSRFLEWASQYAFPGGQAPGSAG